MIQGNSKRDLTLSTQAGLLTSIFSIQLQYKIRCFVVRIWEFITHCKESIISAIQENLAVYHLSHLGLKGLKVFLSFSWTIEFFCNLPTALPSE